MQDIKHQDFFKSAGLDEKDLKQFYKQDLGLRKRNTRHKEKQKQHQPSLRSSQAQNIHDKEKSVEYKKMVKPIVDLHSFSEEYSSFRKGQTKSVLQYEANNMELLYIVYSKVIQRKGIVEILSYGHLDALLASLKIERNEFENVDTEGFLKIYIEHLLEFELYYSYDKLNLKKGIELTKTLGYATFYEEDELPSIENKSLQAQILEQDIVVLKRMALKIGLSNVNLQLIKRQYGEQQVDLRLQNPMDYGFNPYKLINKGDKMKISQYCQYQTFYQNQIECKQRFGDKIKGGKIFFAVNFEPNKGTMVEKLADKINKTMFGWAQQTDILSYLQQHINGCTNPQFYLKVKGCWTGGHQQNVSMSAININHGPDASEWFTVEAEEVQRLRSALKKEFDLDLYGDEGLWFQKINWFIENGFKIKRIVQQVGDIVVSGPGTLHWVRSFGVALQSAWNIFTDTHKSWLAAFHRQEQNKAIRFRKSNIIPLKTLTLKHLDHRHNEIPKQTKDLLMIKLSQWLLGQSWTMAKIKLNCKETILKRQSKFIEEHESFCYACLQQIFIYFGYSSKKIGHILCLKCLYAQLVSDIAPRELIIYERYNPDEIRKFIQLAKLNRLDVNQVRFCSGQHIGRDCKPRHQGPIEEITNINQAQRQNPSTTVKIGNTLLKIKMMNILNEASQTAETDSDSPQSLKRPRNMTQLKIEQPALKKKRIGRDQDDDREDGQISDSDYKPSYHHSKRNKNDEKEQKGKSKKNDEDKKQKKYEREKNGQYKRVNYKKNNSHDHSHDYNSKINGNYTKQQAEQKKATSYKPSKRQVSPAKSNDSY